MDIDPRLIADITAIGDTVLKPPSEEDMRAANHVMSFIDQDNYDHAREVISKAKDPAALAFAIAYLAVREINSYELAELVDDEGESMFDGLEVYVRHEDI